jgi:uncharacterized protein
METQHLRYRELTGSEINEILDRNFVARLACMDKGEVYIVPITYAWDGEYIYSHSGPGRKIDLMRKHHQVCLEIDEIENLFKWRSVIAQGTFQELAGFDATLGMRLLIRKIANLSAHQRMSALEVDAEASMKGAIIFRINIQKISGRCEGE